MQLPKCVSAHEPDTGFCHLSAASAQQVHPLFPSPRLACSPLATDRAFAFSQAPQTQIQFSCLHGLCQKQLRLSPRPLGSLWWSPNRAHISGPASPGRSSPLPTDKRGVNFQNRISQGPCLLLLGFRCIPISCKLNEQNSDGSSSTLSAFAQSSHGSFQKDLVNHTPPSTHDTLRGDLGLFDLCLILLLLLQGSRPCEIWEL